MATMGDKASDPVEGKLSPYDVLWINDDHTLAVNYMCSEMMMGLFTFQWWSVFSRDQAVDAAALRAAANKVIEANVGYDEDNLGTRATKQGDTCEYDWTMAESD